MKLKLVSVVIVAWRRGFVAHIRFSNPRFDEDISADSRWGIYDKVERAIYKKVGYANL